MASCVMWFMLAFGLFHGFTFPLFSSIKQHYSLVLEVFSCILTTNSSCAITTSPPSLLLPVSYQLLVPTSHDIATSYLLSPWDSISLPITYYLTPFSSSLVWILRSASHFYYGSYSPAYGCSFACSCSLYLRRFISRLLICSPASDLIPPLLAVRVIPYVSCVLHLFLFFATSLRSSLQRPGRGLAAALRSDAGISKHGTVTPPLLLLLLWILIHYCLLLPSDSLLITWGGGGFITAPSPMPPCRLPPCIPAFVCCSIRSCLLRLSWLPVPTFIPPALPF